MAKDRFVLTESQSQRIARMLAHYERMGRRFPGPEQRRRVLIPATPRRVTCLLKGALAASSTSTVVDNVERISGISPTTAAGEELTVSNRHGWSGDDNALGRAELNASTSNWELYQLTCPS